jgi:hypothetical protein
MYLFALEGTNNVTVTVPYRKIVFQIRSDFMRIRVRIQLFKLNADPDPALHMNADPGRGSTLKNNHFVQSQIKC